MKLEEISALCDLACDRAVNPFTTGSTWNQLFTQGLVHEYASTERPYSISERGRAFLDYLRDVPLPRQMWVMPSADPGFDLATFGAAAQFKPLHLSSIEDAPPPPPPKPKRIIPTDPDLLKAEAVHLMDVGYGMNEVKEQLELTEEQAQAFFFGR